MKVKWQPITQAQLRRFNEMVDALKKISNGFQTLDQLRKGSEREYGLTYLESLEMAYENVITYAAVAVHGVRKIKKK